MGFSRQECWSGLPCPPPRDLPDSGTEPMSLALAGGFLTTSATWEAPPPSTMLCPVSKEPSDWGMFVSSPQDLTESDPCTHLLLSSTRYAEELPVRALWLGDFSANTGRYQVMAYTPPMAEASSPSTRHVSPNAKVVPSHSLGCEEPYSLTSEG